jgi:hypothetical protein
MHGFYKSTNDWRDRFAIRLEQSKADRGADGIFMAGRIAAAVKIETYGGSFFLEREAGFGLAEHDERNGAVDARDAAALQSGERMKMIRGSG